MNIYGVAAMASGADMARGLVEAGLPLSGLIGLRPGQHGDKVSGYCDLSDVCRELGLRHLEMRSYGLSDPEDRRILLETEIDLLVIMGWQRLLPQWLIDHSRYGGIGLHGSADGITGGRGRSPQNWALIFGKEVFHLSIFFLDAAVDAGPVIDSRAIPLTRWDDIRTSYYKVSRAANEMIVDAWRSGRIERRECRRQEGEARYLPKREPGDGHVDWTRSEAEVFNFVRALTRPYPGAFAPLENGILKLWRARPFGSGEDFSGWRPGEIIARFEYGELLVRVGDGAVIIDDYEIVDGDPAAGEAALHPGLVLASADFAQQIRTTAQRHISRYPDAPLARDILRLAQLEQ